MKLFLYKYNNFKYLLMSLLFICVCSCYLYDYNSSINELSGDASISVVDISEDNNDNSLMIGEDFNIYEYSNEIPKINAYGNREFQRTVREAQSK